MPRCTLTMSQSLALEMVKDKDHRYAEALEQIDAQIADAVEHRERLAVQRLDEAEGYVAALGDELTRNEDFEGDWPLSLDELETTVGDDGLHTLTWGTVTEAPAEALAE